VRPALFRTRPASTAAGGFLFPGAPVRTAAASSALVAPTRENPVSERYFTRREAADFMRVAERTVDRLLAEGRLKALRIGRSVRIRLSDVESFLAATPAR
jgi:excisionase family DNA binding protein